VYPARFRSVWGAAMNTVYLYSDRYDGNSILAQGLRAALLPTGSFQFECIANTLGDLLARLQVSSPDVLLLDLSSEVVADTLRCVRDTAPRAKAVLWVEDISTEMAFQAMSQGVRGILRKSLSVDLLVTCLNNVQAGELWFEKLLTDRLLVAKRVMLSPREGQLVTLLSHGLKNKEIGAALRITEGTVKVYLSRLYEKVGVQDRFELALYALKNRDIAQLPVTQTAGQAPVVPGLRSIMILNGTRGARNEQPAHAEAPLPTVAASLFAVKPARTAA
jgi:two-component system nitrate/nitrite response regulator NarL